MWNRPSNEELAKIPPLYSSESAPPKEKIIHMHFFIGGCDWYAAEYKPEEEMFFGFVILNDDFQNAEWGYFSFRELCGIRVKFLEIDRDLHWKPCKAIEIERIRQAQGWEIAKGGEEDDRSCAVASS